MSNYYGLGDIEINMNDVERICFEWDDIIKKYPDACEDFLYKEAKKLRKEIAANMRKTLNTDTNSKYSLGKASNYRIKKYDGIGARDAFVTISAESPHFHLIENGHDLVGHGKKSFKGKKKDWSGKDLGFVPGYKVLAETSSTFKRRMWRDVDALLDELFPD